MKYLLETLKLRNEPLFYFGLACLLAAGGCLLLVRFTTTQVVGVNAWYKPFKFFLSVGIFAWTMAWYLGYLGPMRSVSIYAWAVVVLLGLEVLYIAVQAGRGQRSHFNVGSPLYAALYGFMALAAVAVALGTAYIGVLFMQRDFPEVPPAYLWGIRLGIALFVVFALQGLTMGSRLTHTIGGPDGGPGLPMVNWSKKYGDLRIAHFVGMHALQVLPLLGHYLVKNVKGIMLLGLLYGLVAALAYYQALQARPLFR